MSAREDILSRLTELGIVYDLREHALAETMDDLRDVSRAMDAVIPKNLFLTPRNKSAYYLFLVCPDTVFRTADISKKIGASRLSFAQSDALDALLRTHPGAISPLGLMFDQAHTVRLLIDVRLRAACRLGFHPNDNTATVAMNGADFFDVFLPAMGYTPTYVSVDD